MIINLKIKQNIFIMILLMFIAYDSKAKQLIDHEKLHNYVFKNTLKKWISYIYKLLHVSCSQITNNMRYKSLRDIHNLKHTIKQISFMEKKANEKQRYTSRYTMMCTSEKYLKQRDAAYEANWVRRLFSCLSQQHSKLMELSQW